MHIKNQSKICGRITLRKLLVNTNLYFPFLLFCFFFPSLLFIYLLGRGALGLGGCLVGLKFKLEMKILGQLLVCPYMGCCFQMPPNKKQKKVGDPNEQKDCQFFPAHD